MMTKPNDHQGRTCKQKLKAFFTECKRP